MYSSVQDKIFIHMDPITIPKAPNVFLEKCSNTEKQPMKAYLLDKKTRFLVKIAGFFSEMVSVAN